MNILNRRKFLQNTTLTASGLLAGVFINKLSASEVDTFNLRNAELPVIISTWKHGLQANEAALKVLNSGGSVLDAVEAGVKVTEADPENTSVGLGGFPDREGNVTLDACIMDATGRAGSVAYLQNIMHPISVARQVMEKTPHVMLVGDGALQFALQNGFKKENLLTESSEKFWKEWLKESRYHPIPNIENHDTIGLIAIDSNGSISGACTTSGMAFKMKGRVGDSPIIGAGLFADNEIGGATATGTGELVMRTLGSFLVVELMRQGSSPQAACEEAVHRIIKKNTDLTHHQVGYLAVNKWGETGAYCLQPGFDYAVYKNNENILIKSESYFK